MLSRRTFKLTMKRFKIAVDADWQFRYIKAPPVTQCRSCVDHGSVQQPRLASELPTRSAKTLCNVRGMTNDRLLTHCGPAGNLAGQIGSRWEHTPPRVAL